MTLLRPRGRSLDARSLLEQHFDRQLVLVVRDAHRHTWQRVAAQMFLEVAPDCVVVEVGLPIWQPSRANYIATNGHARVNLEAAAEALQPT